MFHILAIFVIQYLRKFLKCRQDRYCIMYGLNKYVPRILLRAGDFRYYRDIVFMIRGFIPSCPFRFI